MLFNSYYVSAGDRWTRSNRGQLTRPTVEEIFDYRTYVDNAMEVFLERDQPELSDVITLGFHHEQQHQELFLYDVKRILGDNPLFPTYIYHQPVAGLDKGSTSNNWLKIDEGIYSIGFEGNGFHFDNEKGYHKVFLHEYEIQESLVTNGEYLEFIYDGGYTHFGHWLSEAWDWVNENHIKAPRYWHKIDGEWWVYTLGGLEKVALEDPVCHVSFYEADAFAKWKGCRLPTEQEWEVACLKYAMNSPSNFLEEDQFRTLPTGGANFLGNVWEWTSSPYTPYPFYAPPSGALGEYNGKFMVNQMVLRGGSYGTPRNHIRPTYRNFFHPHLRWMFAGIRLAKHT